MNGTPVWCDVPHEQFQLTLELNFLERENEFIEIFTSLLGAENSETGNSLRHFPMFIEKCQVKEKLNNKREKIRNFKGQDQKFSSVNFDIF